MHRTLKKLWFVILLYTLAGCANTESNTATPQPKPTARYANLLSLYKQVKFDTLQVFAVGDPDSTGYPFKGRELTRAQVALLPGEIAANVHDNYKAYACFAFTMNGPRYGLITRAPAEYNSNAIKLLILDTLKDTITDVVELASAWGDAGDYSEKRTWLVNNASKPAAYMWSMEGTDSSIENSKDTTVNEKNYYYQLDLSHEKHDTLGRNTEEIMGVCKRVGR